MMPRTIALIASLACPLVPAGAMDVRVAGNQLVMGGGVSGDEIAKMRDTLPRNPQVDTVILQDSRGGDVWTAMRLGELFREKGYRTAVSGHCMSACVIIFLGGRERHFADGKPGNLTFLAVHTPTFSSDGIRDFKGSPSRGTRGRIFDWMSERIGTRGDLALLERGLANDDPKGLLYFFDAARSTRRDGVTVFQCQGAEKRKVADCEPVPGKSALQSGLITSETIVQVNR